MGKSHPIALRELLYRLLKKVMANGRPPGVFGSRRVS